MNPLILTLLDGVVILTLLYAVYYMRIVAKSVKIIREGKSEMQQILKEMTLAIAKAEETINGMKRLADDKGRFLQKQIDDAATLTEELKFINQAADHVAQRLEQSTVEKTASLSKETASKTGTLAKPAGNTAMSKAEKDLADALAKRKNEGR